MTAAIATGILVAAGVYLILQRGLVRVTIGFVLLGHAANVVLVASGGMALRGAPLIGDGDPEGMADPLPQAFVLTAIVITFGITVYLLGLVRAGGEDDPDAADPGDPGSGPAPASGPASSDPAGSGPASPGPAGSDPAGSGPAGSDDAGPGATGSGAGSPAGPRPHRERR